MNKKHQGRSRMIRRFKRNKDGALEGLPLYLIILVIIAVVAIAIIVSWLGGIGGGPKTLKITVKTNTPIEVQSNTPGDTSSYASNPSPSSITFKVLDQDGNGLGGVSIELSGCNVKKTDNTGSNGEVTIDIGECELAPEELTGKINVKASKSDYQDATYDIVVQRQT